MMMLAYLADREELVKAFDSNPRTGLSDAQVTQNAERYGRNSITKEKPETLFSRIWHATCEPMILILMAAGLVDVAVNIVRVASGGHADPLESICIFAAIALSVAITVAMEGRSAQAFEALSRITDDIVVRALRNGETMLIHQRDLVCGDIVELATGDKVPADGRLITSSDLYADESALTGESTPVAKSADFKTYGRKMPLADRANMLHAGTFITGGFCTMVITAVGDSTEFGAIAGELAKSKTDPLPLQEQLAKLGKVITVFGVAAAVLVFVVQAATLAMRGALAPESIMEIFLTSIVLVVAAVPEGLPTIVAVALSLNVVKLSKHQALVKKMVASETIGCVNIICSDKTGTLTENRMRVEGSFENPLILQNACVNSTAELASDNTFIGNPTEGALLTAAGAAGSDYRSCREGADIVHVFPFTSEEKDMTTIVREGKGYIAYTKGSPEKVFRSCMLTDEERHAFEQEMLPFRENAQRVIAFAHRHFSELPVFDEVAVESKMEYDGFAAIADPLRADVPAAVDECVSAGIEVKMLTGDNIVTARAIAKELGLLGGGREAVDARELEGLSPEELAQRMETVAVIARSTSVVKMQVVTALKRQGNVVAVTGDGINDAPAIKAADVGIAMGIAGTEVSKEAADIVLLDDSFATIVRAIAWGRGIYENFKRFIVFQLTANLSSVFVVLASVLVGFKAPFTAIQLLWVNIIMDGPPALTLGLEPPHDDLMKRRPMRRNENILSQPLLVRVAWMGGYISILCLAQYSLNFMGVSASQMPTVVFALFSFAQLFNAFNCREIDDDSLFTYFFANKPMILVVLATMLAQGLLIQYAGVVFGTVSLPPDVWVKVLAAAASVIVVSEIVKFVKRRMAASRQRS